jgi:hypothetical protein
MGTLPARPRIVTPSQQYVNFQTDSRLYEQRFAIVDTSVDLTL